jgi:hypothetical protein
VTRVYLASPWVPAEWVEAHGLEPFGIWFSLEVGGLPPPSGAGFCGFAHSVREMAIAESEAAFVFTSHCDQFRRACDAAALVDPSRIFLFNLPATWRSPVALKLYVAELERLGRFLIQLGGEAPSPELLAGVMAKHRRARVHLSEAAAILPAGEFVETLARFYTGGREHVAGSGFSPSAVTTGGKVPLALVGGPMTRCQWPLLDYIERIGGRIVLNATEPGERNLWSKPPGETEELPAKCSDARNNAADLAHDYVRNIVDVFQRPNTPLYEWLELRLREREVRGILLWHYAWCDLWRAEAQTMREIFKLPVLPLDADAIKGETLRKTGRIEAFLEALQ